MFNLKNDFNKKVHFIGIGGISMSGLAEILIDNGYNISGSDRNESALTDKLSSIGAKIYIGHSAENVHGADLVVYTAAVKEDNPEIIEAKKLNIPLMDRAEFLGDIMKEFQKRIAVSGTHGKTTTTSMIALILINAGLDPTVMVGGEVDQIGGNVRPGKSPYFVAEACEYKGSFLKFCPNIGIILNIDADHLDYYKDIDDIKSAFLKFANLIPEDGCLIGNFSDKRLLDIVHIVKCNTLTYGINEGDFTANNITYDSNGCAAFTVYFKGKEYYNFKLSVTGEHNVMNALAAIACCHTLKVDKKVISDSLYEYKGTHRRFEVKGKINGASVIDDYAHHPTEIKATLKAAKNYPHRKIYCVFQPHTYSRTLSLFNEFSNAFYDVDKLILTDIYAAREKDTGVVNSKMLCNEVCKNGVDAVYIKSFDDIVCFLKDKLQKDDIIITMGAGDVTKIGDMLLK